MLNKTTATEIFPLSFFFFFLLLRFAFIWWDAGGKVDGVGVEHGSENSS